MKSYKPRHDRVLVEPSTNEKVMASGIIVPDTAELEKPISGTVIAVGEEAHARVGATVLFGAYAGVEIEIEGVTYLVLRDRDLLLEGTDEDGQGA